MIEMYIYSHCLQVAITTPEGGSWSYPHIKISHPDQERLAIPPGCTFPILFERWGGFFYVPQEPDQERFPKRGPKAQALWGEGGGGSRLPQEQARCQLGKCFLSLKIYLLWKSWPISVSGGSRCGSAPADEWKRCETGLAYGFSSLSEKTRKSNHLQMSSQKKHFLFSYLKTLSVTGPAGIWTRDVPLSRQALSQLTLSVAGPAGILTRDVPLSRQALSQLTLSVAGPAGIWTRDLPLSRQALSQLS